MRRVSGLIGSTLTVFIGLWQPATAQTRLEVGVLECRGTTTSFGLGSVTELGCLFRPSAGGRPDRYRATIRRLGLDIGINETTSIAWAVLAPARRVGPGDLRGSYAGVSAGASVGVGLGANALVGGSNNSFALQPVSLQGQTGLSVAAGIAALDLR
jgi:hypothetical protein